MFILPVLFSSHSSSTLAILTKARTREPKAAVPRWKTAVVWIALGREWRSLRLSQVQNHWENTEASTMSEIAEEKARPQ